MQIAEERSRATPKIPGGEWPIQLACTRRGGIIFAYGRLWVAEMNEQKGHQKSDRACMCTTSTRVRGTIGALINIYEYYEKNGQSARNGSNAI